MNAFCRFFTSKNRTDNSDLGPIKTYLPENLNDRIPKSFNHHSIDNNEAAISLTNLFSCHRSKNMSANTLSLIHESDLSTMTPTSLNGSLGYCKMNLVKKLQEINYQVCINLFDALLLMS